MDDKREILRHFLAALAYRTEKAIAGAPETFGDFRAGHGVRSPAEIVHHMTQVLTFARARFTGEESGQTRPSDLAAETGRLRRILRDLDVLLCADDPLRQGSLERLLQGPFADAMTHAGQIAMLRRMSGSPISGENFFAADIRAGAGDSRARRTDPEGTGKLKSRPTGEVRVRILRAVDAAVLSNVAPGVFDRAVRPELASEFLSDPRHHLVVAEAGGEVVGMASAFHYVHPDKPSELFINEVGVAPPHRRQGIGRRLLEELLSHARALGCREAWVATGPRNEAARALYTDAGGVAAEEATVIFSFRDGLHVA